MKDDEVEISGYLVSQEDWEWLTRRRREPTRLQAPRIEHWSEGTIGVNVGGTYIPREE